MPRPHHRDSLALIAVIALSVSCALAQPPQHCSYELSVAVSGLWMPGAEPAENGLDRQWLEQLAAELGWCLRPEVRDTNIARRLRMIRRGDIDVLIGASRTAARERYARFSLPYREESVLVYVRAEDRARYGAIDSTAALLAVPGTLLALRDSWLGEWYAAERERLREQGRVSEFDTYPLALEQLLHGRGELVIAPDTFRDFLVAHAEVRVVPLAWALDHDPVHFMFSRQSVSAERVDEFDAAIMHLQARGFSAPPAH